MSSKSDIEVNSVIIPALAAAIFCGAVALIGLIGPEGEPHTLGAIENAGVSQVFTGASLEDGFGRSVLTGSDLDGDGKVDLLVAAPATENGGYLCAFSGADGKPIWPRVDAPEGARGFGISLAYFPDSDGDGVFEILVGAPAAGAGRVFLLSGASGKPLAEFAGKRRDERFGRSVCALDDIDGDGRADLAIGAPGDDQRNLVGELRIISGRDGSELRTMRASPRQGDRFGFALAALRDLDGDGAAELAVGAPGESRNGFLAGAVYVCSPRSGTILHRLDGEQAEDRLGQSLDGCRDRDRDGHDDFLVGACNTNGLGHVLLVSGRTGTVLARYEAGRGNGLGSSVASCGDIDHDGVADLAVGAPTEAEGRHSGLGAVYLFSGRGGEILGRILGNRERSAFGIAVDSPGDLDGDGRIDFLVGAEHRAVIVNLLPAKED
ncbi:MAG: VCBS repeat-containing protein [Planctomycetes bacterium]|nr:VCBS repeat-containing protein [Planctomycetota bacterium]